MTHILHLGHQVTDLSGVTGLISTDAAGFDPAYDVNAIRITATNGSSVPFTATWAEPTGDVWVGFRYRAPSVNAHSIASDGLFLEFYDCREPADWSRPDRARRREVSRPGDRRHAASTAPPPSSPPRARPTGST